MFLNKYKIIAFTFYNYNLIIFYNSLVEGVSVNIYTPSNTMVRELSQGLFLELQAQKVKSNIALKHRIDVDEQDITMIETEKSSSSYRVFVWPSSDERFYELIGSHPLHGDPSEAATGAAPHLNSPPAIERDYLSFKFCVYVF